MSISIKFSNFCSEIRISQGDKNTIIDRYKRITKQLNKDFWDSESETSHSLYVGSYGRDTDINTSDIDILMQLPSAVYHQYDKYDGNGQSALLAAVRDSLKKTYSSSHVSGDGQVVNIQFKDGIYFEIVPGFLLDSGSYKYPDTNDGGSRKITNPKAEIKEIREKNEERNYNLKNLCRMARAWRDNRDLKIGGLLIDTFAYNFMKDREYKDKSYTYYDYMTRDFFEYLKDLDSEQEYRLVPGSNQYVYKKDNFIYKAKQTYNITLEALKYESSDMEYSANQKWKEIYGSKF